MKMLFRFDWTDEIQTGNHRRCLCYNQNINSMQSNFFRMNLRKIMTCMISN